MEGRKERSKEGSLKTVRSRGRYEHISTDLKGVRLDYMDWILFSAQGKDQWWDFVNMVMTLHIP
jgi:hypothetical protein